MKHEEKLKKVTADIRAKLPRLMELEKGCLVDDEHIGRWEIIYCDFTNKKAIYYGINEFSEIVTLSKGDIRRIIGKEAQLNDVLEWLSKRNYDAFAKYNGYLYVLKGFDIEDEPVFSGANWDFSKPHLKDQSEELIEFLCELIK